MRAAWDGWAFERDSSQCVNVVSGIFVLAMQPRFSPVAWWRGEAA